MKLTKEEAAELRELAEAYRGACVFALACTSRRQKPKAIADVTKTRAAFERRLAELTEG